MKLPLFLLLSMPLLASATVTPLTPSATPATVITPDTTATVAPGRPWRL